MKQKIFVNLKRFDIPRKLGGICPIDTPQVWIEEVIEKSVTMGLGVRKGLQLNFLLPEALLLPAIRRLESFAPNERGNITVGCQGVFREDVAAGGNIGAFTTNLPATAAKNLGCTWSIIGHSEERKDKLNILNYFEPNIKNDFSLRVKATETVEQIINEEVLRALDADLNVLLCVGETGAERGEGNFEQRRPLIENVLCRQVMSGIKGIKEFHKQKFIIGYEPVWAIGPNKTPPEKDYISFASKHIKKVVKEEFNIDIPVVYGGGLKEENAGMIGTIKSIDGGLVALTQFTGKIAFEPEGLQRIIDTYFRAI